MPFIPVMNFCEENVWQWARERSENKGWAVFICSQGGSKMWAQISQTGGPEYVIWDYHVVFLEQSPEGGLIWDDSYTGGYPAPADQWTQANFPNPDDTLLFRVVPSDEFLRDFRSDRRHISGQNPVPVWPPISKEESNLWEYTSHQPGPHGKLMTLIEWQEFTERLQS